MFSRFSTRKRLPSLNTFNVITLDGNTIPLNLDTRSTGTDLLDRVLQKCGMTSDQIYFSLALQEEGYLKWIIMQKALKKQVSGHSPYTVLFRVYIYPINHQSLFPLARHFLYLQIKQDLQLNRLKPSSADVTSHISALVMQGETGNGILHSSSNNGYSKELEILPNKTNGVEDTIQQAYRLNRGRLPSECEEEVLNMVQEEFTYGCYFYDIQDKYKQSVSLCICPDGVRVAQRGQKINCMKWETIIKVNNRRKHIYFDVDASQTLTSYQANYVCQNKYMAFNIVMWCQTLIKFHCIPEEQKSLSKLKRLLSMRRTVRRKHHQLRTTQHGRPLNSIQSSSSACGERIHGTTNNNGMNSKLVIYGLKGLASSDTEMESPLLSPTNLSVHSQIVVSMPHATEDAGEDVLETVEEERAEHAIKTSKTSLHVILEDSNSNFVRKSRMSDNDGKRGLIGKKNAFVTRTTRPGMENEPRDIFEKDQWQDMEQQQLTDCMPPGRDTITSPVFPPRIINEVDIFGEKREIYQLSMDSMEQDSPPLLPPVFSGGSDRDHRSRPHKISTLPHHFNSSNHQHLYHQHPIYHQVPLPQHSSGTSEHKHRTLIPTPPDHSSPNHLQQFGRNPSFNSPCENPGHPSSFSQPFTVPHYQPQNISSHSQSSSQPHQDSPSYSSLALQQQQYASPSHENFNHCLDLRYTNRGSNRRHSYGDSLPGYAGAGSNSYRIKNISTEEPSNSPIGGYASVHHYQATRKGEPQESLSQTVIGSTFSIHHTHPKYLYYEEGEIEREKGLKAPSSSYKPLRRGSMHDARHNPRQMRTRFNTLNPASMVPLAQQYSEGMSRLGSIVSLDHQANLAELSQADSTGHFDPHIQSIVFEASKSSQWTEL